MCGRYVRKSTRREIAAWFGAEDGDVVEWGESYNVAPQTFQPVVRRNRDSGQREIVLMRWGLSPFWAGDAKAAAKIAYSTINARAETVATAPAFREALRHRRCLVPADAFYEWQTLDRKHKQPFAIALSNREPYGFAGLWERWKHEGEWLETFTIITTDPNEVVAPLHNRMPVILARQDYGRWLGDGNPEQPPIDLLRPFPAEQMTAWKVAKAVGNVRNDTAQLLEPDAVADPQRGLFAAGEESPAE
jgi:putative SOS response-associated peptidase YedK